MSEERRHDHHESARAMERELNEQQLMTLRNHEKFGWELKFVRHPLFQDIVPVLLDTDTGRYAVLELDGTLNLDHGLDIRE